MENDNSKALINRAKELNCLYNIDSILSSKELKFNDKLQRIVEVLPSGFNYSDQCSTKIVLEHEMYQSDNYKETLWALASDIYLEGEIVGTISVYYKNQFADRDETGFSSEERHLLNTVSQWLSRDLILYKYDKLYSRIKAGYVGDDQNKRADWEIILDMQKRTDQMVFSVISKKMLNHMLCAGIKEAPGLFVVLGSVIDPDSNETTEVNTPTRKQVLQSSYNLAGKIFELAKKYYNDNELMDLIRKWVGEEKMKSLVKSLSGQSASLNEIADALQLYHQQNPSFELEGSKLAVGIKVALISKFFTEQLDFINVVKGLMEIRDFYEIMKTMIFPPMSFGKLGGKSAGLIIAKKVIQRSSDYIELLDHIEIPKTWYITSDCIVSFLNFNNLEDMNEQKYKDIDDISQEYPHIIQTFKNSHFPAFMINGLSRALDDFGEGPIIVRSSSLLEDRLGTAFAGKYKSLFLANQGPKEQRLENLLDAIAEVYASIFSPDAIGYRKERGLLDFNEQMGLLIQSVVGTKAGKYFFPAYAGVAFSNNEFRWSPRIKRTDGIIRLVAGLGTRAVDRLGNDFPILISPGQPDLRVNITYNDMVRYSPKFMDVINLETNTFETIDIIQLVRETGNEFPELNNMFSIDEQGNLKKPLGLGINPAEDDIVPTFENLFTGTNFIEKIKTMLFELQNKLGYPVDIEFAADGTNLYILQCRPQAESMDSVSAVIPKDIDPNKVLFSATQFVSNGKVPNIGYVIYVDPDKYENMSDYEAMRDVGRAIGKLNALLPKRSFIMMGPGRWGTRDDIKMGVKVTYADINNTAMLIEIAKTKGSFTPDLSFGTHFFQDLVEADIRYLPLYPDNKQNKFNTEFFTKAINSLDRFLPEYKHLDDVLKVINIRENTKGNILRILMNAMEDKALAYFTMADTKTIYEEQTDYTTDDSIYDEPLQWRKRMSESLAGHLDPEKFGVKGIYLYGSVFLERASADSDIDLIIHFGGTPRQKHDLIIWLDAWNSCLSQINYNKSGYKMIKIIDVVMIEDNEFETRKYHAELLNPKNHASRKLKMNRKN